MKQQEGFSVISIKEANESVDSQIASPHVFILLPGRTDVGLLDRPYRFEAYLMMLCLRGRGTVKINLREFEIIPGAFLIVHPTMVFDFSEKSPDLDMLMCGISLEVLKGMRLHKIVPVFREIMQNPLTALTEGQIDSFRDFISLIDRKKDPDAYGRHHKEVMHHLLLSLLYEAASFYKTEPQQGKNPTHTEGVMKKLGELIKEHYREERKVEFYAEKLFLTPKYLSSVVKKTSGKTVSEWIRMALVLDAQDQLKNSELTVQQISDLLRFPNPSFFGRFFKKHTGMTPMEYRQS